MTTIEQLLAEFIDAWNAGRRPDLGDYLARAPAAQRDELMRDIETWLAIAPIPDYDDATYSAIAADPILSAALAAGAETAKPWAARLAALRQSAGLAIDQVAERLTAVLGLPEERERTAEYLGRAERGELDERRVSRRLVSALAGALGADNDDLRPAWNRPGLATQHFRLDDGSVDQGALRERFDALGRAAAAPAPAPMDELDRLFIGGPEA